MPEFEKSLERIKIEVLKQLKLRGLDRSKSSPDLLINIGLVIEKKIGTRETNFVTDAPVYMGTGNYSRQSEVIEIGEYLEGTFSVDFVDPKSENLVWQGVARGVIAKREEASKNNIAVGAEKLFGKID